MRGEFDFMIDLQHFKKSETMTMTMIQSKRNNGKNIQVVEDPLKRLSQHEMKDSLVAKCEVLERGYCGISKEYYFVFFNRRTETNDLVVVSPWSLSQLKSYFNIIFYKEQRKFIEEILKTPSQPRGTGKVCLSNAKPVELIS